MKTEAPLANYTAGEPFTRDELVAVAPWLMEFLDAPAAEIAVTSTIVRVEEDHTIRLEPGPDPGV